MHENKLILWNKLGSRSEIEMSEIGISGKIKGSPSYITAVHGKGTVVDTGVLIWFEDIFDEIRERGTIEFWVYYNATLPSFVDRYFTGAPVESTSVFRAETFNATRGIITIYFNGAMLDISQYIPRSITVQDRIHYAFCWDINGFLNNQTIQIYMDGEKVWSTTSAITPIAGVNKNLFLGCEPGNEPAREIDNTIDNLKIYNFAKTDFSDRFVE